MPLLEDRDMTTQEASHYLDEVHEHLFSDAAPLLGTGYFSAPAVLLIFCEHLAHLWAGKTGSQVTANFIRDVLGKINPNYGKFGGLLLEMYRHGPVHLRKPKTVELGDRKLGWFVGATSDSLWVRDHGPKRMYTHLQPEKCLHCDRWWLPLSMRDLFDDLRKAIRLFQQTLQDDKEALRLEAFNKARVALVSPAGFHEYSKPDIANLPSVS